MIKKILILLLVTKQLSVHVLAQVILDHANSGGGRFDEAALAIKKDQSQNTYVMGYYVGPFSIGSDSLHVQQGLNVFLAKYTPLGTPLWTHSISCTRNPGNTIPSLQVTPDGTCFLGLSVFGKVYSDNRADLDSSQLLKGIFLKYDREGNLNWYKSIGANTTIKDMELENTNLVILGEGSPVFQHDSLSAQTHFRQKYFLLKTDSAGNKLSWGYVASGQGLEDGRIASGPDNEIYMAIYGSDSAIVESTSSRLGNGLWSCMVKVGSFGAANWVQVLPNSIVIQDLYIKNEAIYLAGSYSGNIRIGSDSLMSSGEDPILVAFHKSGAFRWARACRATGRFDRYFGLTESANGDVLVVGRAEGNPQFNQISLTRPNGAYTAVLVAYDTSGQALWAQALSDDHGTSEGYAIYQKSGIITVAGCFAWQLSVGSQMLLSKGGNDFFWTDFDLDTSIEDDKPSVSLAPNPASPGQPLRLPNGGKILILHDIQGRTMNTLSEQEPEQYVLPTALAPGYYLLTSERGQRYRLCIAPE